ncbi:hypothetical protein [Lacrimispora sp.]|uniref:hypothetical protein n=1 Tax=Lacrimispora sp. TaxID=2719234 RepID=UPI0032E48DDD
MNDTIEAVGVFNKDALKEASKYLIPPLVRPFITIAIIVFYASRSMKLFTILQSCHSFFFF